VSDLLFTTDRLAGENLLREDVSPERIHFVGNTMIDTLLRHIGRARDLPLYEGLSAGEYATLTLHRPSNVDRREDLDKIMSAVSRIAERIPVIFPAHPRTAANLNRDSLHPRVRVVEPLSYIPFLGLMANSRMVLTDSGGLQEETTVLGIPCLTMRPNTERPVTCEIGTNVLVGTDPERIRAEAFAVLNTQQSAHTIPEKWDGHAAERIVAVLLEKAPGR
ncbi:MAG: UDP-N-acetyl glucosamine 2-epimerase, partial [bacterium]|nr:UDP-N-acetyl glucosamine 2-epimerase [bacterium]